MPKEDEEAACAEKVMLQDWQSTRRVLDVLASPEYEHLTHFVYLELDQWPVQPHYRLEALFDVAGLIWQEGTPLRSGKVMAVFDEFPCRDVRGGGLFNMGTYMLRRDPLVVSLLTAWFHSTAHGGMHGAKWPARQVCDGHSKFVALFCLTSCRAVRAPGCLLARPERV